MSSGEHYIAVSVSYGSKDKAFPERSTHLTLEFKVIDGTTEAGANKELEQGCDTIIQDLEQIGFTLYKEEFPATAQRH